MDGWMDRKNIFKKRWMVGWMDKKKEKGQMDGLDGQKKYMKKRWMVGWIKKQIDGWMAIKITENKYGWLEGYKI